MHRSWVNAKERNVRQMRQPCERMPVKSFEAGKGPLHGLHGQAANHHGVCSYICVVIVVDECKVECLQIDETNQSGQQHKMPSRLHPEIYSVYSTSSSRHCRLEY